MNLAEFIEKNDYDGELILNGVNFDMTCSFCMNKTKVGKAAFEKYGKVLLAKVESDRNNYLRVTNDEIKDVDEALELGTDFLYATSGFISIEDYEACFPES